MSPAHPNVDHLIGKQVIVTDRGYTFTGTLRWTTDIDVPGCIDVVNDRGEIEIGGMPWSFDSITEADTTTRCWGFVHADGPTKGDPYEYGDGSPHFSTREKALTWLDGGGDRPALDLAQLSEACHFVVCATCGYSDTEFHYTAQEAEAAARDWDCPTCA